MLNKMRLVLGFAMAFAINCFGDPLPLPAAPPYLAPIATPWSGSWIYYTTDSISGLQYLNGIGTNAAFIQATNAALGAAQAATNDFRKAVTNIFNNNLATSRVITNNLTFQFTSLNTIQADMLQGDMGLAVGSGEGTVIDQDSNFLGFVDITRIGNLTNAITSNATNFNAKVMITNIATSAGTNFNAKVVMTNIASSLSGSAVLKTFNETWVDKSATNLFGIVYRYDRPFLTITNAMTSSQQFDTVHVAPGRWSETGLDNNNVIFDFAAGAYLLYTNAVTVQAQGQSVFGNAAASIDYQNSTSLSATGFPGITNEVFGDGDFAYQPNWFFDGGIQSIDNAFIWNNSTNDWLIFNADHVYCTNEIVDGGSEVSGGALFGIWQVKYANIHIRRVDYLNEVFNVACFFWTKGETSVIIDDLYSTGGYGIQVGLGGNLFQPLNVETWLRYQGQSIQVSGFSAIFGVGDTHNSIDGVSIQVPQIICDGASALIWNEGSPKLYLGTAQGKISSTNNTTATLQLNQSGNATNQVWVTAQKLTDSSSGGMISCNASGTNASFGAYIYKIDQYQELGANYVNAIDINGGTHTFDGGNMILPHGTGFRIGGSAKVTINNMVIDTSNSTGQTNNPLFIYGGGSPNITLNNCTLIAATGVNAINASNSVGATLVLNNCRVTGGITNSLTISTTGTNYFGNVFVKGATTFGLLPTVNGIPVLTNVTSSSINYNAGVHIPTTVTLTGSVFIFTNLTSSTLECYFSGSVAYAVSKNGVAVFGSLAGDGYFNLQPTNICAITYTVAPTFYTNAW